MSIPPARHLAIALFRTLASMKLAVILLVALAGVLAWATLLEADKGRECAQWHVYGSQWFIAILCLLAANILAATLIRFPWKRSQIGFVITHVGLLVLLAGSIHAFVNGVEGQLVLAEGDTEDTFLLSHRSEIRVIRQGPDAPLLFSFDPGPVDWPAGKTLDFGQYEGIGIEVLRYYPHARREAAWVADESKLEGPALKFTLAVANGGAVSENWLAASRFGGETFVGPARFQLLPVSSHSMVKDFLEPPAAKAGTEGILSMHYKDRMYRVGVHENIGKKVSVGDSGISVEIAEYLPNARPAGRGRFVSRGDEPKKPLLELRVHLPDEDKPLRQIAFAQSPLLNLDGVHGRECPVKFWYHHPAVSPSSGVEFLQTPDGKLYHRVGTKGKHEPPGEVKAGDQIEAGAGFKVAILEHIPSARREVTLYPVELAPGQSGGPEAAVLVKLTAGDTSQQIWLQRNHEEHGSQRIQTPDGPVIITFGYERFPLGFSLKLLDSERQLDPGTDNAAAFASSVEVIDPAEGIKEQREISMNSPLVYGKFRFYQSHFEAIADGRDVSTLTVAYDPGRFLKYLGSIMICLGTFAMFYMRPGPWKKLPGLGSRSRHAGAEGPLPETEPPSSPDPHPGRDTRRRPKADRAGVP